MFSWGDEGTSTYYVEQLKKLIPDADPADLAAVFKVLFTDHTFPCMPVKDVLYRAQSTASTFLFVVNFTAADGNAALWPPSINISLKVS
jgi:hypothetical protein